MALRIKKLSVFIKPIKGKTKHSGLTDLWAKQFENYARKYNIPLAKMINIEELLI